MFQFTGFAFLTEYYTFSIVGCPIRISADHIVCADPRSFSQLITSFFASGSLGIPHTPLFSLSPIASYSNLLLKYFRTLSILLQLIRVAQSPIQHPERSCIFLCPNMSMNVFAHQSPTPGCVRHPSLKLRMAMWRIPESNRWPPACKAGALAS